MSAKIIITIRHDPNSESQDRFLFKIDKKNTRGTKLIESNAANWAVNLIGQALSSGGIPQSELRPKKEGE